MLEFAVGGGRPPASSELLQVRRDGRATYLVGNALPRDEAGLYQVDLAPSELRVLADLLSRPGFVEILEKYGPVRADSGFQTLTAYGTDQAKKIKWGTFAKIPEPLAELQSRLLSIIEDSRQHQVQTIKATLQTVAGKVGPDETLEVECLLHNTGSEPVQLFLVAAGEVPEPDFRIYAATSEEAANASPWNFYEQAQPMRFVEAGESQAAGPIKLSSGDETKTRAQCPAAFGPDRRLFGFLEFTMKITLNDELFEIRCSIMTKPATSVS